MTKKQHDRLKALEAANADGNGAFLFVEKRGGLYYDAHTGRSYTSEKLQALHDARPELVIICTRSDDPAPPPHPASNPSGFTLDDQRRHNELLDKQDDPDRPALTPDEKAVLDNWDAVQQKHMDEWEAWDAATRPGFEESVRRVERLNARARARKR